LIDQIRRRIRSSAPFLKAADLLSKGKSLETSGLKGAGLAFFLDALFAQIRKNIVVVTAEEERAEQLWSDLSTIIGKGSVFLFPEQTRLPWLQQRQKVDILGWRLQSLGALREEKPSLVVTTIRSLTEEIPGLAEAVSRCLFLRTGEEYAMEDLVRWLAENGYERVELVSGVGEFSVRGGIVDVYPYELEHPVRLEFFGDEIESIRIFDVVSQRSREIVEQVRLLPVVGQHRENLAPARRLLDVLSPERTLLFLDGPEMLEKALHETETSGGYRLFGEGIAVLLDGPEERWQRFLISAESFQRIVHRWVGGIRHAAVSFGMREVEQFRGNIRLLRRRLRAFLEEYRQNGPPVAGILLEEDFEIERLHDLLQEDELNVEIARGALHSGFIFPEGSLLLITEYDLFGKIPRRRQWGKFRGGIPRSRIHALQPGDLVVHVDHGIGRFLGLEKITVAGSERECLKLQYRDGDILYVHIEHLHRVSKYTGTEGMVPQLSKLGGKDWERIKERTRKAVEKMARDLLHLYAVRKAQKGFAFSPDTLWQKELEASFVYDETPDQLKAIEEVKRDMESESPMDRLICGDVGFGKTEVALRAAFKAVMDGKQVAVLVPTTVLAQQHYMTFTERLANFPVQVELLSRFRTKREQQQVLEGLRKGTVDIVIGTHRLLSGDVQFKDLGLLIVDEEHRFGVRQKEKLKSQFKLVDVLYLTATPIPRTLHMALTGTRDMSIINTAPKERRPVIVEVAPFDQKLIRQAILNEVHRGGQVFVVHNRVRSIFAMARLIQKLVPDLRIAVAHGQMPPHRLEKIMTDFVNRKYDCLVSTMIIESGLDMPNVNTLIVNRADKLGLAQLYQIKGRVGRSNRQAYAYFLVPPFKFLTPNALKRLQTIEEHMELGAGLQIAMKDLEIRGAGNLLGPEQSGYINAVGFDLYCKLLNEAVARLRAGEKTPQVAAEEELDVTVDVDVDAYIPNEYITLDFERLSIYQRLSAVRSENDLNDLEEELRDRFGPLPPPVRALFQVARIRILCRKLGIERIKLFRGDLTAHLSEAFYGPERQELLLKLIRTMQQQSLNSFRFLHGKKFGFKCRLRHSGHSALMDLRDVLLEVSRACSAIKEDGGGQ